MSDVPLSLKIENRGQTRLITFGARDLVIAGWTSRDRKAREEHIQELATLGVAPPVTTPVFYRVSVTRLTTRASIEVVGTESSGEIEFVLFADRGQLYVGLGSDHTDRGVETYGVTASKQMCEKPISSVAWPFAEVVDHWDSVILRSYVTVHGDRELYQEGKASAMLSPDDLLRGYTGSNQVPDGLVLFGGTLPANGGVRGGQRFEAELIDPGLGRRIELGYDISVLPIEGQWQPLATISP